MIKRRASFEKFLQSPFAMILPISIWAVLTFSSFYWNHQIIQSSSHQAFTMRGEMSKNLSDIIMTWASSHEAIYVPLTEKTPSSPYFDIKNKDIKTSDGVALTQLSAGQILSQLSLLLDKDSVEFQLISTQPLNPANQASTWQIKVLQSLLDDSQRHIEERNGQFYYIAPLFAEQSCLDCHKDNQTADLLGAVSFNYPIERLEQRLDPLHNQNTFIHSAIFIILSLISALAIYHVRSLVNRISAQKAQREETIRLKTKNLHQEIEQHKVARAELQRLATHDPLTGIRNRRHFIDSLHNEIKRYQRYKSNFSLLMLDLDHFKKVNDTYGHDCGDYVLQCFAKEIQENLRQSDVFVRYGGEEFAIIATNTQLDAAERFAQKLTKTVEALTIIYHQQTVNITVSIGVAAPSLLKTSSPESLISLADSALYQAKALGRNRAICATPDYDT
ncbi:diguanylate cyclase [Psychrobium sp. 1_MG-2023]|uniref:diguanylate cyclase n=1 Tax=Psychrobium sp. 1_MG-2023 TaxID=3062624 RepID=UPI000C34DE59|nr:diguanylate cyclase [Psychrobium sp. 1_MG-2023]MDP2562735.1 diguanylate cyclase [Psychrobium sp. 1_MG-2023]PKF54253.1 hypothetical protein CW748_16625 [Alteromonadales bacterium alter-6D02]